MKDAMGLTPKIFVIQTRVSKATLRPHIVKLHLVKVSICQENGAKGNIRCITEETHVSVC